MDGNHDDLNFNCQVGDNLYPIDNHNEEFKEYLQSPEASDRTDFEIDFDKATITDDYLFHIPASATMFRESHRSGSNTVTRAGRRKLDGRKLGGKDPEREQKVLVLYVTVSLTCGTPF